MEMMYLRENIFALQMKEKIQEIHREGENFI
jgi:hypothetical protein